MCSPQQCKAWMKSAFVLKSTKLVGVCYKVGMILLQLLLDQFSLSTYAHEYIKVRAETLQMQIKVTTGTSHIHPV